ncbi:MAG: threonine synthase [Gemmatimonadales bacterium]|nr:threonine synthase [Gemmatimonadales bacterium]
MDWYLECSLDGRRVDPAGLPTVCECGQPLLVRYERERPSLAIRSSLLAPRSSLFAIRGMWRWRPFLPIANSEQPIALGEGDTPLLEVPRLAARIGLPRALVKDEGVNPTGSFKARGLSAAVTRAVFGGAKAFTLPTAGNAGVAASAYGARAGVPVRVYAPKTTPAPILAQIVAYGGDLVLLDGHIGDCGKASRAYAAESGAFDLSTLREPYRIEGKKTLGLEIAEQLGWSLPDAIIYPTGGGTGLIGMWKAFHELRDAGWVSGNLPRMYTVQAAGCAPVVKSFESGADRCEAWAEPWTIASGLRVPGPLGDRLMLRALRESGGGAVAVTDAALALEAREASRLEGIDFSPEGGAAVAAAKTLQQQGVLTAKERVVLFNTGAGWLYRNPAELPPGT